MFVVAAIPVLGKPGASRQIFRSRLFTITNYLALHFTSTLGALFLLVKIVKLVHCVK